MHGRLDTYFRMVAAYFVTWQDVQGSCLTIFSSFRYDVDMFLSHRILASGDAVSFYFIIYYFKHFSCGWFVLTNVELVYTSKVAEPQCRA